MASIVEMLVSGLMLGALYALFGLGLSLSLGVMRMINIAHGDLIVLGAYLALFVIGLTGWTALPSLLIVMPLMFAIGWLLQTLMLNRVVGKDPMSSLLLTFGLSIVLQNLLQEAFTANTRFLDAGELALKSFQVGDISIGVLPLATAATTVVVYALTQALVAKSHLGRQVRAVADDAGAARLVGVNDRRLFALMTGFILAVISIAAVLYGIRTPFSPTAGPERLLFAFEAVVLGGLGSLWGTFVGGLIVGLAQVLGQQINTGLGAFFGHVTFLIVLVARPQGLFAAGSRS
jgi:branched-chain amino acid transport system permease protein